MKASFRKTVAFGLVLIGLWIGFSKPATADDWLDQIARFLGISKTPSQLKTQAAPSNTGNIFIATLGDAPKQVTADGGYRSPVFLPDSQGLLALKGDAIVQVSLADGAIENMQTVPHIVKLLGVDPSDADRVLVLLGGSEPGVLALQSGQMTPLPYDRDAKNHRRMMSHLRGENREYEEVDVYVKTKSKARLGGQVEWTDVYVKEKNAPPINISRCDGVDCSQPALSPNGQQVVFIKADSAR